MLWEEYTRGKQSYEQLALKYDVCIKTIQRKLDLVRIEPKFKFKRSLVVLADTTYFGHNFGVMVFLSSQGEPLYWRFVKYETVLQYKEGFNFLIQNGLNIKGIVCDGRRGLLGLFPQTPVQMCQYHQVAIIRRYITNKPKSLAAKELKELVRLLTTSDKESFYGSLSDWHLKWKEYINQRSLNINTGKSRYTHRRLRSAYLSLERNKPYLFIWYDYPELGIPNTNNQLEGTFTDLKNKLRNHNGLGLERKQKFINDYFSNQSKI